MKALFLCLYYSPEKGSSEHLFQDTLLVSASLGFTNFVLAPNPVRGLSFRDRIKSHKNSRSDYSWGTLLRFKCFSVFESNKIARFIRVQSFVRKVIKFIKKTTDISFIYVPSNPPIFLASAMEKIAKKRGFKVLYNVNDIYPDVAFPKGSLFYRLFEKAACRALQNADVLTTLSSDMKQSLIEKGVVPSSIHVIDPWSYPAPPMTDSEVDNIKANMFFSSDLINVSYIGNLGSFQNVDCIIKSARYLANSKICIHIIGSGRQYKRLKRKIRSLPNVLLHPRVDSRIAKSLYKISDINLITLKPGVIHYACPSKTPLCVESGRPLILSLDPNSEYARSLCLDYGAVAVAPDHPSDLAEAIEDVAKDPKKYMLTKSPEDTRSLAIDKWRAILKELI